MSKQVKKSFRPVEQLKHFLRRLNSVFHHPQKDLDVREVLAAREAEAFLHNRRELGNVGASHPFYK